MMSSRAELEEERRLFYVAITRAKKRLFLSYALSRYRYGHLRNCEPSRFLDDVDGNRNAGPQIRAKFQKEIPALDKVQQEVKFSVAKTKGVQLPDGRTVPVRSEHAALNTLLQGSGAIVSKLWMCIAYTNLKKRFGNLVHQVAYVHDELQYSCHKNIADEVGKTVS